MTAATPTKPEHIEDVLGENGPGELTAEAQTHLKAYVDSFLDSALKNTLDEQVQAGLQGFLRDNQAVDGARPALAKTPKPNNRFYNAKAVGAPLDGEFDGIGDMLAMLQGVRNGNPRSRERLAKIQNAFGSIVPGDGGFLVPEEFRAELLRVALETAVIRSRARVIPMATPRINFPSIDSTSNASTVYGGVAGYWTDEGAALTASSATFGRITLDAKKLTAYTEIPNELLADSSISVSAFVDQVFPEAIAWFEDVAFIKGSGVGEPLGFTNAANPSTVTVAAESSGNTGTILFANCVKMMARMLPTSLGRCVWLASIDTMPALVQMQNIVKNVAGSENVGGQSVLLDMNSGGASSPYPMSLLGRPVIFTEKLPTLASKGDLNLVDLSYYLIGDRQQMTAMASEHYKFNTDTTAYRFIERVDGRPWLQSAITPNNSGSTLSPFVNLQAR